MLRIIKEVFSFLSPAQRRRYFRLQILVILMAFSEIIAVASIAPFMAAASNLSILQEGGVLGRIYLASGASSPSDFLLWLGICVFLMMMTAELVSIFVSWRLSLFAAGIGSEIANRLYKHYMQKNWLFHASTNSASLINQVSSEAVRVGDLIISPLLQMNARIVLSLFICTAMFIFNPKVVIVGAIIFSVSYITLYYLTRALLAKTGALTSRVMTTRFKLMSEGFGGIKDVLLLGRKKDFLDRFETSGKDFTYCRGTSAALMVVSRYTMELVAFGSIILLVLFLTKTQSGNLNTILPILAAYALAGLKLLPSFQVIYHCVAQITYGIPSFENIKADLKESAHFSTQDTQLEPDVNTQKLSFEKSIELKDVVFSYKGKPQPALNHLNLHIPAKSVVALVGTTGSGKSTAVDVLLGLIHPPKGQLLIDGQPLSKNQTRHWQNTIGFVPQSIYLSDASIAENVAFGLPAKSIELDKVKRAIKLAHLDTLIEQLPDGLDTKVGERGIQLSGGQRQRIGIARALYDNAEVLIFDEATSALDGVTERLIMDAIQDFTGEKTIIMIAHRLATVKQCDLIYLLENGQVIDHGTYDELNARNATFHRMATHA